MKYKNKVYENDIIDMIFHSLLWAIMLIPLYLSIMNAMGGDNIDDTTPPVEFIMPEKEELTMVDVYSYTDINGFIWENEQSFTEAFRQARSLLGPDQTFNWNGNEYTTMYKDEN